MTIQELKKQIENGSSIHDLIIFKNVEYDFISNQYIKAIAKLNHQEIEYIDSLDPFIHTSTSLFEEEAADINENLRVFRTDEFIYDNPRLLGIKDLIIVTSKISSKSIEKLFERSIVIVPKLETWQIKDYAYSVAEGVNTKDLDWLLELCGKNINRLSQELDKLSLFTVGERKYFFEELIRDGAVDDLSAYGIFNFTTAIIHKDYDTLIRIYNEIDRVDINEFGLLKILLQNFKNLVMVQLQANPTPDNTGLESKQLWAIKKIPKVYSPEQLVNIFSFLSDIDRQVKNGELPTDIMIDYMTIKILSM